MEIPFCQVIGIDHTGSRTLPGHWTWVSTTPPDIDTFFLFFEEDNATNGLITEGVTSVA